MGRTTLRDYDEYTFTHSVNVCIFSVALGRKIGLTKIQLYDLGMTAVAPDIGKAKIPIDVLNKVSGLSEDEWRSSGSSVAWGHDAVELRTYERFPTSRSSWRMSTTENRPDGYPGPSDSATWASSPGSWPWPTGSTPPRRGAPTRPFRSSRIRCSGKCGPIRGAATTHCRQGPDQPDRRLPVGTCVVLDTFEVGIVSQAKPDRGCSTGRVFALVIDAAAVSSRHGDRRRPGRTRPGGSTFGP